MNKIKYAVIMLAINYASSVIADSKLSEIVVSPSQRTTTIFDSLSSVEVITQDQIQSLGYTTVDEILSHSSSISIGSNGGHGQTKSIFMRGTESNHTKVLINGVALNPGTLGVPSIQHISVEMLDRIEISKGSMSTLYGRDTIGGVINIITKKNYNDNKTQVFLSTGRDETNKIGFNKNFSFNSHQLSINYMNMNTDGYKAKVSSTKNHGYENDNLNIDYNYSYDNNIFELNFYQSDGNTEYDSFGSNLNQDHKDSHTKLTWNKNYENSKSRIVFIDRENKIDQMSASATDYTHTKTNEITLEKNFYNLYNTNTILGATITDEALYELSYGTAFRKSNSIREFYFQSEYMLSDTLFNLGARHINHSLYGDFLTGNLNIGYSLNKNIKLIGGIGKSFRSPDGTDLFGYGGNPNLEPEESTTRELSMKYKVNKNDAFIASVFSNSITNLIESDGSVMQNINRSKIQGIELGYYGTFNKLNYALDYSFIKADDLTNNVQLSRRPENKIVAKVNYRYNQKNNIGISFIGSTKSDNSIYDSHVLGGHSKMNVTYLHNHKDYTIQLKMNNIFDKKYRKAHNYNSEGRSYYISIMRSF